MSGVPRKIRHRIKIKLSSLESKSEISQTELDKIENFMDEWGVPPNSSYRAKLDELRGEEYKEAMVEELRESAPEKATYSGRYTDSRGRSTPIRLKFSYDHLFLSRKYQNSKNSAKVSWRFENNGSLYLIDLKDLNSKEITHLINSDKNGSFNYSWNSCLDSLISIFRKNMNNKPIVSKLELLAKFGFTMSEEILTAAHENKLEDSTKLYGSQRGLTEVYYNPFVKDILENVSRKKPDFEKISDRKVKISYRS